MPRQIYNEGRVVGYSAYEVYVRQHISEDPNTPPATEREWLSSSLASGASLLLKVPAGTYENLKVLDFDLPEDTRLCAANTIIGSFFQGEAEVPAGNQFAKKITDYGVLISNNSSKSPSNKVTTITRSNVPTQDLNTYDFNKVKRQLSGYCQILDGIVIQPGTWSNNNKKPPQKEFSADLSRKPVLRLLMNGEVKEDFFVLLTGFTIRTVLSGTIKADTSVDTSSPQDGDFLGPASFPWANKIIFTTPSAYISYFESNKYSRKLPTNSTLINVDDTPVIDMKHTSPETYYVSNDQDSRVELNVQDFSTLGDGTAVLTVYQRSDILPPALYGTYVDTAGKNYLNPLDTVAPGTVKLYHGDDGTKAEALETNVPNNIGLTRDSNSYVIFERNQSGDFVPVSDTYTAPLDGVLMSSDATDPYFVLQHNTADEEGYYGFYAITNRRIYGNLSDKFREACGMNWDSAELRSVLEAEYPSGRGTVFKVNTTIYDSIPEDKKSDYYYVLQGPDSRSEKAVGINSWTLVPIRIKDGHLDYIEKMYIDTTFFIPWGNPEDIPDTVDPEKLSTYRMRATGKNHDYTSYLGTWWNFKEGGLSEDHPTIHNSLPSIITSNSFIMDPNRRVPLGTANKTWQQLYKEQTLRSLFTENALEKVKLHRDYWHLTLHDFLQTAKIYDMRKSKNDPQQANRSTELKKYFVKKGFKFEDEGLTVYDSVNFSCSINAANYTKSILIPIPEDYASSDGPLAAINVSGNHQTMSLSMSDINNTPYDLSGTDPNMIDPRDDSIHWDDLVNALAHNKSIDVMGVNLRNIKAGLADGNYIVFPNGLRLYISDTEPSGNIPVGSIGIGWGISK